METVITGFRYLTHWSRTKSLVVYETTVSIIEYHIEYNIYNLILKEPIFFLY